MSRLHLAVVCTGLLFSSATGRAQQPREFVVGCLDESRDGWSLLGPGHVFHGPSHVAELLTSQFGSGSVVPDKTFRLVEVSELSPESLADIDIFHLVFDVQGFPAPMGFTGGNVPLLTNAEIDALVNFVESGRALLVFVGWLDDVDTRDVDALLGRFGMRRDCLRRDGTAQPGAAVESGPFGVVQHVTWRCNYHNGLRRQGTDVSLLLDVGGNCGSEALLYQVPGGPGCVAAFGDYFNSYTHFLHYPPDLVCTSTGYAPFIGNLFDFVGNRVPIRLRLVGSGPPDGFIDPRAGFGGIDRVTLTFSLPVNNVGGNPLDATAVTITSTDNPQLPGPPRVPDVFAVDVPPNRRTVVVTLTHPIPVGEWTTISAHVEGASGAAATVRVRVGRLPCDVNQSGHVSLSDAGAYGRAWRKMPPPTELLDMDRSGVVTLADPGLFGALFKGRRGFRVWDGMSLPPIPQ